MGKKINNYADKLHHQGEFQQS